MTEYRIKQTTNSYFTTYKVQRKFLFFWVSDPSGVYHSLEDAKSVINHRRFGEKIKYIEVRDE